MLDNSVVTVHLKDLAEGLFSASSYKINSYEQPTSDGHIIMLDL